MESDFGISYLDTQLLGVSWYWYDFLLGIFHGVAIELVGSKLRVLIHGSIKNVDML